MIDEMKTTYWSLVGSSQIGVPWFQNQQTQHATKHDTSRRPRAGLCACPAAHLGPGAGARAGAAPHVLAFTRKGSFLSTREQETSLPEQKSRTLMKGSWRPDLIWVLVCVHFGSTRQRLFVNKHQYIVDIDGHSYLVLVPFAY